MHSELRNPFSSPTGRRTARALAGALALALAVSCAQQQPEDATVKLNQLFDDYWEYQMREYPTWASALGDRRYDSLLTDESQAAHDRRLTQHRNFLNRLNAIDRYQLAETDQVSADIFELQLSQFVEGARFNDQYMPINQQGGPHLALPELISALTFTSYTDYENFYKRMQAFPRYIDQHIKNMRAGMDAGLVSAKINIEPTLAQMASFIVEDPRSSVFYGPVSDNAAGLADDDIERLKEMYEGAIEDDIVPAYRKLKAFVEEEYLPACREEFGVWALPDGAERYKYLIQYHTTLPLTPEEIVQTGLDDLARIEAEMDSIIATVGFEGTRQDFFDFLHSDPRFYYTDKDSLLDGYRAILADVKQHVPTLFGILPQADCIVKELEEFRSKDAPTAYYNQPAEDGSRPGFFYA
ncbi:MAG TPA: DUF885 domain-containing protein, partial [candidate division Zixibacteria bacterium]|nr:DUF885 domain-containing protein [candidate division Zixibacteria bacterium]